MYVYVCYDHVYMFMCVCVCLCMYVAAEKREQKVMDKNTQLLKERNSAVQQLTQLKQRAVAAERRVLAGMCT